MIAPSPLFAASRWLLLWIGLLVPLTARAEPRLAYVRKETIYTARAADGRDERRVCTGDRPCISHDGRRLAYTRSNGPPGTDPQPTRTIVVRDLVTGAETDLPVGPRHEVFGALWSPDDTWVAYNVLAEDGWQVAAAHPDGSGFRFLTGQLPDHEKGYGLAGWNLHDGAVLVHNFQVAVQLDPATGAVAWTRPLADLIGKSNASVSDASFTISADGRQLIYARDTDEQEILALGDLSMMSTCLALADFPDVRAFRRVTPKRFTVLDLCVSADGTSVYLSAARARDIHSYKRRGQDALDIKERLYRYDLRTGKLVPLAAIPDAWGFSVSRD